MRKADMKDLIACIWKRYDNGNYSPAGSGFMVRNKQVLTCAHVVNEALGRSMISADRPGENDLVEVSFDSFDNNRKISARVVQWFAPQGKPTQNAADVALLKLLEAPPSEAVPELKLCAEEDLDNHPVRMKGFPSDAPAGLYAEGILKGELMGWVQMERHEQFTFVSPGYSGSPAWDKRANGVVGMVVAVKEMSDNHLGFIIPTKRLISYLNDWLSSPEAPNPVTAPGTLSLASYVNRSMEEKAALDLLNKSFPVYVHGATRYGKSQFIDYIIQHWREEEPTQGDRAVVMRVSFAGLERDTPQTFLRQLAVRIAQRVAEETGVESAYDDLQWPATGVEADKLTKFMTKHILPWFKQKSRCLVLVLENGERIWNVGFADDVFGLILKTWPSYQLNSYQKSNPNYQLFKRLRLFLEISTTPAMFLTRPNVLASAQGIAIREFTPEQANDCAKLHGLPQFEGDEESIKALYDQVSGHPYLIRAALYEAMMRNMPLRDILKGCDVDKGPPNRPGVFCEHLLQLRAHLEREELDKEACKALRGLPPPLGKELKYRLINTGLFFENSNDLSIEVRSVLYKDFIRRLCPS